MKKVALFLIIAMFLFTLDIPVCLAAESSGLREGGASLLIPGWGQYMNGEFETQKGKLKVSVMAALEIAAIVTTAVVGGIVGYPLIWVGIGIFILNHAWSAFDAFMNAGKEPGVTLSTAQTVDKVDIVR